MSSFVGNDDEMVNRYPNDEQAEALIRGDDPGEPESAGIAGLVASIRSLGDQKIADKVAERHVAMVVGEAAVSPRPDRDPVVGIQRPRRRIVLSTVLSSLLAKVMAATVALAAVGSGVGVAADASVPGDFLYGLDRAMEAVGVADGGAAERIDEARGLVEVDLPAAVEAAAEAAANGETEAASAAVTALETAALRVGDGAEGEQSALTRQQVAALLEEIAAQLQNEDGFDGAAIAEQARLIRPEVELPEPVFQDEVPPVNVPPDDVPPPTPVPTIPDEASTDSAGAPSQEAPTEAP
jgi:hypothetical protein